MKQLVYIFLVCSLLCKAQDKLFFSNGTVLRGTLVSVGKDVVYFKTTEAAPAKPIRKSSLIMAENYQGTRWLFASDSLTEKPAEPTLTHRNLLGIQPLGLMLGRFTLAYEHLGENGAVGFVFPVSLTFFPNYNLSNVDTIPWVKTKGVNMMIGAEVNFYFRQSLYSQFFIGPRVKYGTDIFLLNTEFYTVQTQCGWKLESPNSPVVQHFSIGFGFMRILASSGMIARREWYGCYSLNYRFSLRW